MHTYNTVWYLGIQKRTWALETVAYVGKLCEGTAVEFSDAVGAEAIETQGVASGAREHQHKATGDSNKHNTTSVTHGCLYRSSTRYTREHM